MSQVERHDDSRAKFSLRVWRPIAARALANRAPLAILLAGEGAPLPAVTLAETLAVSDVPGGVVNILTGNLDRPGPAAGGAWGVRRASSPWTTGRPPAGMAVRKAAAQPCHAQAS